MSAINALTTLAYVKGSMAVDKMKSEIDSFNSDERGVEGFVVALILIGIAAVLAGVFKTQISALITSLITKIKTILEIE